MQFNIIWEDDCILKPRYSNAHRLAQTAALASQPSPHTLHLPLHLTQGATSAIDQVATANR